MRVPDGKDITHATDKGYFGRGIYTTTDPRLAFAANMWSPPTCTGATDSALTAYRRRDPNPGRPRALSLRPCAELGFGLAHGAEKTMISRIPHASARQ